MTGAPLPADEATRLAALAELGILDSGIDEEFDALVAVASTVCGMPISLISLLDDSRQWFKAAVGLPGVTQTPREHAFCGYTILGDDIFEVPDATADSRFVENPLVTGAPNIRFYAGMPLRLSNGHHAGSLCVIGTEPARLNDMQRDVLRKLGRAAAVALDGWAARRRLEATQRKLADERQRLANLIEGTGVATWEFNVQTRALRTNGRWQQILGTPIVDDAHVRTLYHPGDLRLADDALRAHIEGRSEHYRHESRVRHSDGRWIWLQSQGSVMVRDQDGAPEWVFGWARDVTERREQEEALRRSERLMAETGRVAGVGGWEIDLVGGGLSWTPQAFRIAGIPPDRQPTMEEALAFYPPEARQQVIEARTRVLASGGAYDVEVPFIRADGRRIWVRSVGSAVFEAGRPVRLVGAFMDVTAQVDQRRALDLANERMKLAVDSGGIGLWDWDIQADDMVWDEWVCRLYGIPGPTYGTTYAGWLSRVHPADLARVRQHVQETHSGARPFDAEFRVIWHDGSVHTLKASATIVRDASGAPVRAVGTTMDVTEPRRLAAALAEHDELLQVTLNSIGDAVITADASARIVWLNPVAERLTGWPAQEAAGRTMPEVFDIIDEDTRARRQDLVAACLARREAVELPSRTLLISRTGVEYGIKDSVAPIRGRDGEIHGVVIVFHDETRERRLKAEREARLRELGAANAELDRHLGRARSMAEQANRAKTRFLAGMSHELRTPLNGILGYAQLLHIDGGLTTTQSERVQAMMTAGTHLLEMVHCVLDLSDIETGGDALRLAETDLRQLSEATLEMVRPSASAKRLALRLAIEPAVPRLVMADARRIRQVLLNLLGNAVKHTTGGGVELRLRHGAEGTRLRFEVLDTGPGIPADRRHRLFDAAGAPDVDAGGGESLGLPLAAKFAGLMGGSLGHEDNGGGSLFWLEVPLLAAAGMTGEAAALPAPPGQQMQEAAAALPILVVDDIAMNRDIAAAFLQSAGYVVMCAEGGNEAVQEAAGRDWLAVLMDVRMPDMDGLEATRRIRGLLPPRGSVPIIALTAQAFADEIETCRAAGMDSHVAKPFTFDGLLEGVRRGISVSQARRASPHTMEPGSELAILDVEALGRTAAVLPAASIAAYLSTLIEKGEALQGALRRKDAAAAALADAAHAMAGSAGMFGFDRLAFVARRFERAVKAEPSQAPILAGGLDLTLTASLKAMRNRVGLLRQTQPIEANA